MEGSLLERDAELGVVDQIVEQTLRGQPAVLLIDGSAGIGKTRLLGAARDKARAADHRVLTARASDLERELPFGVVRQLFEPALADPKAEASLLEGAAAASARVFEPPAPGNADRDGSFSTLYGLFWLTANIAAEGPLLLAIDDLHCCDRASLRFLAYLERRLEGLRVLVAATVRSGEPAAESRLLGELAAGSASVTVRPAALSRDAVAALVRERLGKRADPTFCDACSRATGGNPLLLTELIKTLGAEGVTPDAEHADMIGAVGRRAVSHMVLLRLARLPADAVPVARAVAVLGDGAEVPLMAALTGLDESRVAEATHSLVAAEILRGEPSLQFVHPLVRDAVYHDLTPSERELLHEQAAEVLRRLEAPPERVATHLLAVPSRADPEVAALLRETGVAAGRRGDAENAVPYLRRALDEPVPAEERPQLLLELGLAEAGADPQAATEHLREAYDSLEDPQLRVLAASLRATLLLFTRSADEGVAVVRRAVAELPPGHTDARQRLEAFELYCVSLGADVPDARARLRAVREEGVEEGIGGKMLRAVAAWDWALHGGRADDCAELALNALADGTLAEVDHNFMAIIASSVLILADRDEGLEGYDAAMSAARRYGSPGEIYIANTSMGGAWLERGELAEATRALEDAFEQIQLLEEDGSGMAYTAGFLARVRLERGDLAGARKMLAHTKDAVPYSEGDTLVRRSRIEILLAWEARRAACRMRSR